MNILLIYPATPETFWSFKHVLPFVSKRASFPPLGLLTVAAMLPREWNLKLVDMNVNVLQEADLQWADYVMLSAMIVHKAKIPEIVHLCKKHGKPVIAGGPLFTTGHANFPEISHFVLGEAEEIMPRLIEDIQSGHLQPLYTGSGWPDVTKTPPPRLDLIDMSQYVTMPVQFSRGCPFECEFCDVIIMNGRVPRLKSTSQMLAELEAIRLKGWKDKVFIVDDNFIGNRAKTKAFLQEVIQWRAQTRAEMGFLTEASANLADDPELCDLMVRAGFKKIFVGIETPSIESLEECHKVQNRKRDLVETVQILQRSGLEVMGGFIVGFDNDKTDIFKRQFDFIQQSGVVTAMVGLLNALPGTRLHERLLKEGRLETQSTGNNTEAAINFRPKLNKEYLIKGYCELMKSLYEPRAYYQRISTFLTCYKFRGPRLRLSGSDFRAFLRSFWFLGIRHRGRRAYWRFVFTTLIRHPKEFPDAMELAIIGHHFRKVASRL